MATHNKSLQLLATKLGLGDEEKVLRKAAEFERLLQTKTIAGSNMTDTSKVVICLDLAAFLLGVELDTKTAIKYSGLKAPTYTNCRKVVENLLEINSDQLTVPGLCVMLQCNGIQALAGNILEEYRKQAKMEIDLNLPQYVCMAVHQACRLNKVKISKSKLTEKSRLKPAQWAKLEADWTKFVNENFATTTKKRGRPPKTTVVNGETENAEIEKHPEETSKESEIEPYDEWKKRMLEMAYKELKELEEKQKETIKKKNENIDTDEIMSPKNNQNISPRKNSHLSPRKNSQHLSPRKDLSSIKDRQRLSIRKDSQIVSPTKDIQRMSPRKIRLLITTDKVLSPRKDSQRVSPRKRLSSTKDNLFSQQNSRFSITKDMLLSPRKDSRTLSPIKDQYSSPRKDLSNDLSPMEEDYTSPRRSPRKTPQKYSPYKTPTTNKGVRQLRELSKGKYVSVLLLGEGLIGDTTVMIEFTAVFGYLAYAVTEASQIALLLLRFAGGGLLLGLVMGQITATLLSLTYYDVLCSVTVTLAGAYLTFYIGEKFFYVSGLLGTIIVGIMVSKRRATVAGEVEQVMSNFWNILSYVANTLVFSMVGVVIFEKASYVITERQVALIFVTYTTVYCSRLLVYSAMTPILRRIGYGITWHHSMACVWGGLRGPLSLCLALIVLQTPGVSDVGEIFIIQTTGLVLLSLLINATTMQKVLKMLGLAEISLAKKANMTNCVKRVMLTRDRCISMLKMDKFLADANWDLVQEGTTIKHPYQLQMSGRDEDSDDDTYMGYRYTTCPDCEREILNEPTKKEFAEMMREANQRVLKAMKISYWRQYEHGKISKEGVRTLVQAVEVAADSDNGRVNLEVLGALWRPKAHAIWLRRKLVNMMIPEAANAQVPRHPWRQYCYRLVSNVWFDGFIYLMILCNTPVILLEVVTRVPVSNTLMYTVKSLNLFFYIIYVLEMVIKMLAYTISGYFKSHWNKLDFFIIVMATGDLVLDILDTVTPWDKWNNFNSSVLTATKLLRMLRFLRLCKLARVSVPKVMAYIDRMIDVQLAFGYDVGKGFVTGEQEVCSLLPQLVDNIHIQDNLNAVLEADRLTVTRQLGLLQRDRPWTAITVKTRQATTSTLNIMLLDAMQLKEEGFLDEMEYKSLVNAIQEKVQLCRHKGSLVAPSSPETQLRAVSWLQNNQRVADYFIENSEILNYNYNDILISRGDEPKGLYILVSGLLEATYVPPDGDIDEAIPNYEFLTDLKFSEPSQDYIVSGNAIGVLGVLTNRPYSYTVRCDTAVQAYYITMPVIKEAFNLAPHPIMGLESAMWREIGIKLALMVLPSVPAYHGWATERLSMRLEHAFVPCLKAFKIFVVNELMEDIVLLDGICQDMATREVFQPPCYVPRTAHRLIFPKSSEMVVTSSCPETKLLIIPAKDTDELDIMEDELDDTQCELVSNASSRCLYHHVWRKLSAESRRPRGKRRRAAKRVNYRDSVWRKQSTMTAIISPSEKELNAKYYKPSVIDLTEKGETATRSRVSSVEQSVRTHNFENDGEVLSSTVLPRNKTSFGRPRNL
ncbi:sperm-specific sodium:proton exchanger [Epargyreus clarus]|uniref:sperm-specific sodium:proton exchanger n=1 Tax=Epargyreus clarus TaxID=520877 RepID=UPI003C2B5C19